jgi:hypothetical protein
MMTISLLRNFALFVATLSFLSGCVTSTPVPVTPPPSPLTSPLPTLRPAATAVVPPVARPVSGAGKGGVIGRLVAGSPDGQGYVGGDLYLGSLIPASDPQAQPMISFSENVDPKAGVYQSDGNFAFGDIQPGEYALIVWNPVSSFVVELPNGGGMVRVKVEPDAISNLGTIVIP